MILIIGLGNPGEKYKNTRHNIGNMVVKKFAETFDFPEFKINKNFKANISKRGEIILSLPNTFMNESGIAVKLLNSKFQILNSNLWVVHDDLDLSFGKIKISRDCSSAGHKGVQSIIDNLKTKNFVRFRVGIAPSQEKFIDVNKFVLKKFPKSEQKNLQKIIELTIRAISVALESDIEKAMNQYN